VGLPGEGELIGRIALSAALGLIAGTERALTGKAAGMRTHALVAVGSAAFTVAGFAALGIGASAQTRPDITRIAAQVATGIGFLGGGLILVQRDDRVRGLTTAAHVWAVAAVGVLCGLGLLWVATATTGLLVLVVAGLQPLEARISGRPRGEDGSDDRS
jgi:putative Mg2+ transporter-C (MgtC) family protein